MHPHVPETDLGQLRGCAFPAWRPFCCGRVSTGLLCCKGRLPQVCRHRRASLVYQPCQVTGWVAEQLGRSTVFNQSPRLEYSDLVVVNHRVQPVSNCEDCAVTPWFQSHHLLKQCVCFNIHVGCALVHNENGTTTKHRSREAKKLPLPDTQTTASLSNICVQGLSLLFKRIA